MKTKKLVCYNCGGHGFITATYENGQTSAICPVCGGIGTHEIQMTNADRIRAMSDEELANIVECPYGNPYFDEHLPCKGSCHDCLLLWLQMLAEEDGKHE